MTQAGVGWIICRECDASYNSERELLDHKRTAHRKFGSDQTSSAPNDTHPDRFTKQPREQKETPNRDGGSGQSDFRQGIV